MTLLTPERNPGINTIIANTEVTHHREDRPEQQRQEQSADRQPLGVRVQARG